MSAREPLIVEAPTLLQRVRAAGVLAGGAAPESYLRWVGSKRHLIRAHAHLLPAPQDVRHVHVPFVGGGSVALYYAAAGVRVTCSDTCEPLITTHREVQRSPELVTAALDQIERRGYSKETYYDVRYSFNVHKSAPAVQRAAWFITISRWGVNGIYRVSKAGECNTPFGKPGGKSSPKLCVADRILSCSMAFQKVTFHVCDFGAHMGLTPFEKLCPIPENPRPSFVYFDPPYAPASDTANFTAYSEDGFGLEDQKRLAALLPRLDAAGVRWALSNSDVPLSRALFEVPARAHGWHVTRIERNGSINSKTSARGKVTEIFVRNYRNPGEAA